MIPTDVESGETGDVTNKAFDVGIIVHDNLRFNDDGIRIFVYSVPYDWVFALGCI